jgi:hypothetical protein
MTPDELFEKLASLSDVQHAASVRAEKLACEGKLKHPGSVTFHRLDDGGVSVSCEHVQGKKNVSWEVEFLSDGRFSMHVNMNGSSDARIRKVLKAIGEMHRKAPPADPPR